MTPRHLARSPRTSTRRVARSLAAFGLALPLALAACGGDDDDSVAATVDTDAAGADAAQTADTAADDMATAGEGSGSATPGVEQDAGYGGAGHWSAAQLCTLNDLMTVGAMFPGVEVIESTGIDDPDHSACLWEDASIDPLDPAGRLFTISQTPHSGDTFSDSFETVDIPGADQAVFGESLYSDTDSGMLIAVGDQLLTVEYVKGTAGAREVAELIATVWVSMQAI